MTRLTKLKAATTLDELAAVLGYKASGLAYVVYHLPDAKKYKKFKIPKRGGGDREICAPHAELKLLQKHLANVLYACRQEYESAANRKVLSHGFRHRHSIVSNARPHKRRRYVLNLDIQDFFPSFNFGRVRGFFIKNNHFALHEKVATIIAQIACFENKLPQGSPCSPIISDLIAHPLDVRLAQLARKHRITYTRYADDLTFSTSQKDFPAAVAQLDASGGWVLQKELVQSIERAGFAINPAKTRMQLRERRQLVTGLTVNAKVNIRADYYRCVRSMCNALFQTGSYFRPYAHGGDDAPLTTPYQIEGMLNHIHHVKDQVDTRSNYEKAENPAAARQLYKRFLSYRNFVALDRPLIICEGKTDSIYLKQAIRHSPAFHPVLGKFKGAAFDSAVRFFNYQKHAHKILQLTGGSGPLKHFINDYKKTIDRFKHRPLLHPVIILIDNDEGAKDVFSVARGRYKAKIDCNSADTFYHLTDNLYLIKTPEPGGGAFSCIEDLFEPALLATELNGKKFKPGQDFANEDGYGKIVFAEKVVRPNAGTINFGGFTPLLTRIVAVLNHYKPPVVGSP